MSANLQKSLNFFRKYADNVFDNGKNMDMNLFSAMMSTNLLENEIKVCEIAEIKRLWTEHLKKEKKSILNLYLGMPYCKSFCSYCNCCKGGVAESQKIEEYSQRLSKNIESYAEVFRHKIFTDIYFGGGTPTLFTEKQLQRICKAINNSLIFSPDGEKTVECNPSSVTYEKLHILHKALFTGLAIHEF